MKTPPKYDAAKVGQVILFEVIEQHPAPVTIDDLSQRIVADHDDRREVKTLTRAVHELREWGLVRHRDGDKVVEPTQAALRAYALLMEFPGNVSAHA